MESICASRKTRGEPSSIFMSKAFLIGQLEAYSSEECSERMITGLALFFRDSGRILCLKDITLFLEVADWIEYF